MAVLAGRASRSGLWWYSSSSPSCDDAMPSLPVGSLGLDLGGICTASPLWTAMMRSHDLARGAEWRAGPAGCQSRKRQATGGGGRGWGCARGRVYVARVEGDVPTRYVVPVVPMHVCWCPSAPDMPDGCTHLCSRWLCLTGAHGCPGGPHLPCTYIAIDCYVLCCVSGTVLAPSLNCLFHPALGTTCHMVALV